MERAILALLYLRSVEDSVAVGGVGMLVEAPSPSRKLSPLSPAELKATKRVYSHPIFKQNLGNTESVLAQTTI